MDIKSEIGARLRKLREDRGLKQRELADHLGLTAAGYGKMETGERGLSSEYCIALADYYGVTCDYILRGIEAEYVDVCKRTGLNAAALDELESAERSDDYRFVLNHLIVEQGLLYSLARCLVMSKSDGMNLDVIRYKAGIEFAMYFEQILQDYDIRKERKA